MEKNINEKEIHLLEVSNLSFHYENDIEILKDINIKFQKGKLYSIVGTSGSGKTTLVSLIAGLDKRKKGDIFLRGENLDTIGLETYRNRYVSIIFQGYNLLNYMTAIQNITSAMEIKKIKKENNKEFALEMLKRVGLTEEQGNQKVLTLSGGQQQRVAIARALCCESDIIIADEPTGNLDENTTKEIIELFKDIVYKEGKTVIMVTHDKEIARETDAVFVVKNKQVIEVKK